MFIRQTALIIAAAVALAGCDKPMSTGEEGAIAGGAGSAVLECLAAHGLALPVLQLGIADQLTEHGDPAQLLSECGLDARGIALSINRRFPIDVVGF